MPKVNLELWHDLSKESKSRDLSLQELQKGIVKASQPIIQLFDLLQASVIQVMEFLTDCCHGGKGYSTINT